MRFSESVAIVTGAVQGADRGESLDYAAVAGIVGKAALFLFGALALGLFISPRLFRFASRLRGRGVVGPRGSLLAGFGFVLGSS